MEVNKIYFDMDGVLADFKRGVKDICGIEAPEQPQDASEKEKAAKKAADDQMWELIREAGNFYDRLELMPGAKELFDAVYGKYGEKCEILTAVPKPERHIYTAEDDKKSWVKRILSEDIKVNIVVREEKIGKSGKGCVLIDDLQKNIDEWTSAKGTGVLNESAEKTMQKLKEMGII